jgi:pSer/pThr/pTyr-binding forkhead associated (FHA) protein
MPVIQLNDQQYTLRRGQTLLGSGPDVDVRVGTDASMGVQAVLDLGSDGQAVIRRADEQALLKVNGFAPGADPVPLIHGDTIELAGVALHFSDDESAAATEAVPDPRRAETSSATPAPRGRLVSLADGREYPVPERGIALGRDPNNDVVVNQNVASRHHARIAPHENGFVISDESTNGVMVNGTRIEGSVVLGVGDVIRIGTAEFRFYSEAATWPRRVPPPVAPSAGAAPEALSQEPPTIPMPIAKPADVPAGPVLATLEILQEGPNKGQRIELRDTLAHVGRGAYNEVPLNDDSVSDPHARLELRDDAWYVADTGSEYGTFVGGVRISSERRLEGTPDIRFGGVRVRFRPADQGTMAVAGTRRSSGNESDAGSRNGARRRFPRWVWIAVALAVVAGIIFFMQKG